MLFCLNRPNWNVLNCNPGSSLLLFVDIYVCILMLGLLIEHSVP